MGDYYFIYILLRGFEIFFVIFGLVVNRDKKEVFIGNMDYEIESRILNVIGYKLG